MFWDLFPTWGGQGPVAGQATPPIPDELDRALLDVMRRILDAFAAAHPDLRPELRRYAEWAGSGCIQ